MKRRVAVDFTWYFDKAIHAGPKARKDVSRTLGGLGYEVITIFYPAAKSPVSAAWKRASRLMNLYFQKLIGAKEVLFQYPSMLPIWYLRFLRYQGIKVTLLIHDLDRLRQGHLDLSQLERGTFNSANTLIVHTPAMKEYLRKQNISADMKVLYLFDYYTDKPYFRAADDYQSIVFCGNLGKSGFLTALDSPEWKIKTYLYGVGAKSTYNNPNVVYKGVFPADDPSDIEGAWGLVWDGPDPNTCASSPVGRYLSYNTSHKISLYLAIGKPVIIWSGCALAQWIVDHGLGISVNSLNELDQVINGVPFKCYQKMKNRLKEIQDKLKIGYFLQNICSE